MTENKKLVDLATKVFEYRKQNGFSKKLSEEIQNQVVELCNSGVTAYAIGKAIGIPRITIAEWTRKFLIQSENQNSFSEVKIVEELKPSLEIKLSTVIKGCRVEIVGSDYSRLQRLLKRINH